GKKQSRRQTAALENGCRPSAQRSTGKQQNPRQLCLALEAESETATAQAVVVALRGKHVSGIKENPEIMRESEFHAGARLTKIEIPGIPLMAAAAKDERRDAR